MRILMTADPVGGVWSYALELCAALDARRHTVLLATLGGAPTPAQRQALEKLPHVELRASDHRLEWMPDPWDSLEAAGHWLLALERELAPDIVHLNHLVHGDLPWQAPVLVVGHSCVLSWWWAVHGERAPATWQRYEATVRASLAAAAHVAAPSRAMRDALHRWYGPLTATSVVANARSAARFHTAPKEPVVLAAGRLWDAAKNVATLCEAAPAIAWPVHLAGASVAPDGTEYRPAGVRLLGQLAPDELAGWYARAAIYALPARYEPFGLTALEAALSGCALVLGDIPSLREVWGDAAEYVPPEDPRAIAAAVNALIAKPDHRRELVRRAQLRAQRYTPERSAAAYLRLYATLVGVGRRERSA